MSEELWLDYSFARPSIATIKALGYGGVMRYLSLPADNPKNITATEAHALRAAGLKIGLVWETTANRASAGAAAGTADAHAANAQADALGYPKGAVIFYAVDFDASVAQVKPYFDALKAAPGRPVGLYGGIKLTGIKLTSYNWQTVAWSNGNVDGDANLYQRLHATVKGAPSGTDENILLNPFPAWGSVRTPKPKPQPQPQPSPQPADFTVVGWNCYVRNSSINVQETLHTWAKQYKPDAICLSEARTHAHAIAVPGYTVYQEPPSLSAVNGAVNEAGDSAILLRNDHAKGAKSRVAKMRKAWEVTSHHREHTPRRYQVVKFKGIRLRSSHWPTHGKTGVNAKAWAESFARSKRWLTFGLLSTSLDVGDFNEQITTLGGLYGKGYWVAGSGIDGLVGRKVKDVKHTELDKGGSDHHGQLYEVTL